MPDNDNPTVIVNAILERRRPEVAELLYIDDLMLHAREFQVEYDLVSQFDGQFPCIRNGLGSLVPLALGRTSGLEYLMPDWFPFREEYFRYRNVAGEDTDIQFIERGQARELFRTGMIGFLSSRLRSISGNVGEHVQRLSLRLPRVSFFGFGSSTVSTSGFRVEVSAATPNLRVHVSPTFRRKWRYFSSPTSPAVGTLTGGLYEFGVDGGSYPPVTPDLGVFDIPYQTVTPLLAL